MIKAVNAHNAAVRPAAGDECDDAHDGESVCERAKRKLMQYSGIGAGALFVLIPNSELIHSAFRAFAGASVGYQCC